MEYQSGDFNDVSLLLFEAHSFQLQISSHKSPDGDLLIVRMNS